MKKELKRLTGLITAAAILLFSVTAFAGDNKGIYQNFVNSVLLPDTGLCDFEKSYANVTDIEVNDYFSGLISAFTIDLNSDNSDELVVVESDLVSVYDAEGKNVRFVDDRGHRLIGNYGDSFANIFIKTSYITPEGGEGQFENFLCIETCAGDDNKKDYIFSAYRMNTERRELIEVVNVKKSVDSGSRFESCVKDCVSTYSYSGGDVASLYNPNAYASFYDAVKDALSSIGIDASLFRSQNRLWFWSSDKNTAGMTGDEINKAENIAESGNYRITEIIPDAFLKTYVRATNVNTQYRPVVSFEDLSILNELVKPVDKIRVTIDGEELEFTDQSPVMKDNRVLVPMRAIFEALGADVMWLGEMNKVVANTSKVNITMTIGSQTYYVNGETKTLDIPPQIINDRTMVPVRAISESLGCSVDWDQENLTVVIKTGEN